MRVRDNKIVKAKINPLRYFLLRKTIDGTYWFTKINNVSFTRQMEC